MFDTVTVLTVTSPVKVIVASPETLSPPSIVKVVPLIDAVIGSVISTILGSSISSVINAGTSRKRIYIEGDFVFYDPYAARICASVKLAWYISKFLKLIASLVV